MTNSSHDVEQGPRPRLTLGEVLRKLRMDAQLTQSALEERAGLGASTVSDLENDASDVKEKTLEKLVVKGLRMSMADFQRQRYELQWGPMPPGSPPSPATIDPIVFRLAGRIAGLTPRERHQIESLVLMIADLIMERGKDDARNFN